jgi:hypothetical protein
MPKGIKRQIDKVITNVTKEIHASTQGGFYAAGLSSEGYLGGYRQALWDVKLALNGNKPNTRGWWDE